MSVRSSIQEISKIKAEIKRNLAKNRELRKRLKVLDKSVLDYLDKRQQPGVKWNGQAIYKETKMSTSRKKKLEKEEDSLDILRNYGIKNPKKALQKILDARKGECVEKTTLKFRKFK